MKLTIIKGLLCLLIAGLSSSCEFDMAHKLNNKINELEIITEHLDSMVKSEMNNTKNFDSLIDLESDKLKKLDSVIRNSASKIDSMSEGKIERLKEILK